MTSRNWWICKTALVFAAILMAAPLLAQNSNTPLDTLFGIYFAPDTATAEKYLVKSTREQLATLDAGTREALLQKLMLGRTFQNEGVVSKRLNSGKTVLELQPKEEKPIHVDVDVQMVSGNDAIVWGSIHGLENESIPVVAYLRQEDGEWRLARVAGPVYMEPLARLDSPDLARGFIQEKLAANQASAVGSLRTLNTAEVTYASTYTHGYSPDIKSLDGAESGTPSEGAAQLIDTVLGSGTKNGYTYTYSPGPRDASGLINSYTITARPVQFGQTGTMNLFTDQSGVIRMTKENRPATVNDPPLG